jgi:hypothetical protein
MTWELTSGNVRTGGAWRMTWTAAIPAAAAAGEVNVTVEDIKGLTRTVAVTAGS